MANKRQKQKQLKRQQPKKQPKQQTYRQHKEQLRTEKIAREMGISKDQAKHLQSYNRQQRVHILQERQAEEKKQTDRQKRREQTQRRYTRNIDKLVEAGYTPEEAYKYRTKNQKQIAELVEKLQQGNDDYLLVFVRDITGGRVDAITGEGTGEWSEAVYWQKQMAKGIGIESLMKGINAALEGQDQVGNIGEAVIDVVPESHIENTIDFRARQDFFLIYKGQGKSYKSLVVMVNNVMNFLYLQTQRDVFIQDLHANLKNLGNAAARRNADRIYEYFLASEAELEKAREEKKKRRRRNKRRKK